MENNAFIKVLCYFRFFLVDLVHLFSVLVKCTLHSYDLKIPCHTKSASNTLRAILLDANNVLVITVIWNRHISLWYAVRGALLLCIRILMKIASQNGNNQIADNICNSWFGACFQFGKKNQNKTVVYRTSTSFLMQHFNTDFRTIHIYLI